MYFFYILRCFDNSLYSGQTNNLEKRVILHNIDKCKGAKYTKSRRPVKLVYFEEFKTRTEALHRETEVKSWTKLKKENLVCNKLS